MKLTLFIFTGLVFSLPVVAEEFELGRQGPPKSTLKTYRRTDFQERALEKGAVFSTPEKSTLETYKRGNFQEELLSEQRQKKPDSGPKSTLQPYSRGTFQEDIMTGEREPDAHPNAAPKRSYRHGENTDVEETLESRRKKRMEHLGKVRDAMLEMGHEQLAERLNEVMQKNDGYYDKKSRLLGIADEPTESTSVETQVSEPAPEPPPAPRKPAAEETPAAEESLPDVGVIK